jgi:hypothetical protein
MPECVRTGALTPFQTINIIGRQIIFLPRC